VQYHHSTFPNQLTLVGETNSAARSVALGFFVKTGSRDETPDVSGVTHFLEHMVFKGTPHRTALDVNRDFDRIGAQYNAFTSEENTVFHAAVLPEYLPQAFDILADILRPSLRDDDFQMEKNVIIEEIGMYEDQPTWSAYDHAKRVYFADHPLGNSILGTPQSITALQREQMHAYFQRRYVPGNIDVVAAGNFKWGDFVKLAEKHCGSWSKASEGHPNLRSTSGSGDFQVLNKEKVTQEHVILVSPGPPVKSPKRYAADILATVLGDDSGSRLYWALVDPGYAESADCSFHEYHDTGAFYISFSCEPERTQKNLAIVHGILSQLQKDGITAEELAQAKSKVLSRVVRASERPMGRMMAIGMQHVYCDAYYTVDAELGFFAKVTQKKVRDVLESYPLDQATTLALGPLQRLKKPQIRNPKSEIRNKSKT
jgi:predicted Zn-dependent peptidase